MRRKIRDDDENAASESADLPWRAWSPAEPDTASRLHPPVGVDRPSVVDPTAGVRGVRPSGDGRHAAKVYGEPSTFGAAAWHDPRGWWKLSSNGEANDIRSHFGRHGDVAVAAVSLRGNRHRLHGEANQDSFSINVGSTERGGSFIVVAVCDGMGSGRYSAFGARLAASRFVHLVSQLITESGSGFHAELNRLQHALLQNIRDAVLNYREHEFEAPAVDAHDLDSDDVQCTLSFAVIPTGSVVDSSAGRRVLLGYVGDSPIHVLSQDSWRRVHDHGQGEIWDTATEGLLSAQRMNMGIHELRPDESLLISTDGLGNYLEVNGVSTVLGCDLAERWRSPVDWMDFVIDASFQIQGADDDRTAVMVWPGSG